MPPRKRRPRGSIGQLPSGSFRATVYAGIDPLTGKMRQIRETAPTYEDAEKALTRLQTQVDEDQHPKSNITVRQAVEQWLEVVELADTTRERYDDLIVEENTPPGLHKIVPDMVFRIDSIVVEVAYTGWRESDAGDKKVRKELRAALKNFGLPVTGELFNNTYEYVRENY